MKQASKGKRRSKAVPALGAVGLSLSLASGASAATSGAALDTLTRNAGTNHEITLRDEEVCDVGLATSASAFPAANADHIPAQTLAVRTDHPAAVQDKPHLAALVGDHEEAVGPHNLDGWRGGFSALP